MSSTQTQSYCNQHQHALRYFSLKPLHHIQQLAHNFVTVKGIAQVTLVEFRYKRGGEIESFSSENILRTLISKIAKYACNMPT